jgi:TetR/AcrR family transcriptional regulator, ethionamide resistance regulator
MPPTGRRRRHVPGRKPGDERRAELLGALQALLEERPVNEIGIGEITRAAAVTRSAFYFYFASKAAAVAALLSDFYDEMIAAASDWYEAADGSAFERLHVSFQASVAAWRGRAGLMVAMLDAVGTDAEVRELWQEWIDAYVERATSRIEDDRAGLARESVDARMLATALVGAVFHVMERDVRSIHAGNAPSELVAPALTDIWHRAIYS